MKENKKGDGIMTLIKPGKLIVVLIILFCLSLAFYLHKKEDTINKSKSPFAVSTHSGERISEDGQFKLCLSPYTIYKNLPHQKTELFTINSQGFRGNDVLPMPKKRTRIIVVGGSNAYGAGGLDQETFEVLLEKLNPNYEVINAGVIGFLSGQELTYIVTDLVDFRPHIIIAFNGWNDLHEQWYHDSWFPMRKEKDEMGYNNNFFFFQIEKKLTDNYKTEVEPLQSFKRFLKCIVSKSSTLAWVRTRIWYLKQRLSHKQTSLKQMAQYSEVNQEYYFHEIVNNYTKNLKKMNDPCASQGIKFVVVFQPELGLKLNKNSEEGRLLSAYNLGSENYPREFPALYKRFIENTKTILKRNKVKYLDINTAPEFFNSSKTLFIDAVHTNKDGNEIIAKIINKYLLS